MSQFGGGRSRRSSKRETAPEPQPPAEPAGADRYYVKLKATVSGPFDMDQLRALQRRAQLARFSQVSTDAVTWRKASDVLPDLFAPPPQPTRPMPAQAERSAIELASEPTPAAAPPPSMTATGQWYHAANGQAVGPIEAAELQRLIHAGQVGPETPVWSEGMPAWIPCRQAPGFVVAPPVPASFFVQTGTATVTPAPAPAPADGPRLSGLAVTSLVLGLLGCTSVLALIFGLIALNQINSSAGRLTGKGMAIAGIVLGGLGMAISAIVAVVLIVKPFG